MASTRDQHTFSPILERDGITVSESPWGHDDEVGRLNFMTAESRRQVLERLNGTTIYDLAVDYFVGMPVAPPALGDPNYNIWMTHTPQGSVNDSPWLEARGAEIHTKHSYCCDSISMSTHTGTHIDTLNHFGFFGCFWNGWSAENDLGARCWTKGGAEKYPPIVSRGVLLDVAGLHGVACLPDRYVITVDDLKNCAKTQGVELQAGNVVLVRTGQMTKWPTQEYVNGAAAPGIGLAAAKYLCEEAGAMCIAGDSMGLEASPTGDLAEPSAFAPVHCYLFATAGCQIMEVVNMEEIAAESEYEFAFLAFPLKLRGATGSPIRPTAVPLKN